MSWSGLGSGLGSAFSTLVSAGLSPTVAHTTLTSLFGSSVGSQEQPILNSIVANYANTAVVQDEVTKALEVPNLPANVAQMFGAVPALAAAAAASPAAGMGNFMAVIAAIEKALGL